jgi:CRISPR-associated exonuclease Cas4
MEAGHAAQDDEEGRERRRSLRAYGLQSGERSFRVWLASERLGLRGQADMVIRREDEVIPVEYKNSPGRWGTHIFLQVAAYGMLLTERERVPARRGFVYYIPQREAREVSLDAAGRTAVRETMAAIREMVRAERMPGPPDARSKCTVCEFHRFCNDVI